jgi:hypothetical protein
MAPVLPTKWRLTRRHNHRRRPLRRRWIQGCARAERATRQPRAGAGVRFVSGRRTCSRVGTEVRLGSRRVRRSASTASVTRFPSMATPASSTSFATTWADRHQVRLRRLSMRRLHPPRRRRAGPLLRHPALGGRRKAGDHHRGAGQGWQAAPRPAGLDRPVRHDVRPELAPRLVKQSRLGDRLVRLTLHLSRYGVTGLTTLGRAGLSTTILFLHLPASLDVANAANGVGSQTSAVGSGSLLQNCLAGNWSRYLSPKDKT